MVTIARTRYSGKTPALDKPRFEACELLAVIHGISTLLAAPQTVMAGSHSLTASKRPDETQVDVLFGVCLELTPSRGAR